jgi:hypothetical protein
VASPGKKAFLLRLDPQVWAALEKLAAAELRSANGQAEFLLREALLRRGLLPRSGAPEGPDPAALPLPKRRSTDW